MYSVWTGDGFNNINVDEKTNGLPHKDSSSTPSIKEKKVKPPMVGVFEVVSAKWWAKKWELVEDNKKLWRDDTVSGGYLRPGG